jgi:hypothetical protein
LGDHFLELGKDELGFPAQAQRHMQHMHAQIAHHAYFPTEAGLPFPVDGLGGVQVAGVQETGFYFQYLAQPARKHLFDDPLGAGQKGHLGAAAHKAA